MPLITKMFLSLQRVRDKSEVPREETQYNEAYDDFDEGEEGEMGDEGQHWTKDAIPAPTIPQRSERRASRMLEDLASELASVQKESADGLRVRPQLTGSDPHESYLSSEEEASESADDYDESIIELDYDRSSSSLVSRSSHEDTARVVSFIYAGKPQLVDIFSHDSSVSSPDVAPPQRRPSPICINSDKQPRSARSSSLNALGPSASSLMSRYKKPLASISSFTPRPTFLQNDPFPSELQETQTPPTDLSAPKTPAIFPSTAWIGSIKGMQRSLTVARRKPSIPKLSLAFAQGGTKPQSPASSIPARETPKTDPTPQPHTQEQGPVNYKDIMRNVIRSSPLVSPTSPKPIKARATTNFRIMGRRKSLKGELV